MLNKKGERELAYIVIVDAVEPIEGYDKIAFATVGGWHCVVDASMKAGDRAVYFEIDSLVPAEDERFAFCQKYKYRIKTQRYCKGTRISQGLLLPFDLFPELKGYEVGDFVTDKLKVTYYEAEDRQRKGKERPSQNYKPFFNKIKKRFPCKQLLRTELGRKILFALFGVKKKKKKWPEFMPRSDEERLQNMTWVLKNKTPFIVSEKIDGCIEGTAEIFTDQGPIRISKIVNQELPVKVLSYNEELNICEYKKILNYKRVKVGNHKLYRIQFAWRGHGNRPKYITFTDNHEIYTNMGWIRADQIKEGDIAYHFSSDYVIELKEILLGCLLGDSSIADRDNDCADVIFGHSIKQKEYFEYKQQLFGDLFIRSKNHISGYGSEIMRGHLHANLNTIKLIHEYCLDKDGKKYISEKWANALTPISLAFWYMDDGSITNRDKEKSKCRAYFNTQSYSYNECLNLKNALYNKYNIVCIIGNEKTYKGYILMLDVDSSKKLFTLINPYICKSMRYKMPIEYENDICCFENKSFNTFPNIVETEVKSVQEVTQDTLSGNTSMVYDIEVEDNHNYFAKNILIHNCSSGYAIRKKPLGGYQYYVCSRNVVLDSPNSRAFYDFNVWYEMYEKYHIKDFLTDYIKKTGAEWVYLQGESFGANIQKRDYSLKDHDFRAFALNDSTRKCRCSYVEMAEILDKYDIPTVPILDKEFILPDNVEELLEYASGESKIDGKPREGIVLQSVENPSFSFKAVDPEYLLCFH